MFVAAVAILPPPAEAQEIHLDTIGRYRGFWQTVEPGEPGRSDQAFSETLATAFDGVIVERAVASYHLGFALTNDMMVSEHGRSNQFGFTYDLRADVTPRGPTPVSAYARRQSLGYAQGAGPGYRMQTELAGYSAGLMPRGLPALYSTGFTETRRTESGDQVRVERLSEVMGRLAHQQGRLVAMGDVGVRRATDLTGGSQRDVAQGDVYADYRVKKDVKVVARSRVRSVDAAFQGDHVLVGTENSEIAVDWRPGPKTATRFQYRLDRSRTLADSMSSSSASARLLWFPSDGTAAVAETGVGGTWYRPGDLAVDTTTYFAEYARVSGDWNRPGDFPLRLAGTGGVAVVSEPGAGVGVQDGVSVNGSAGGRFAGGRILVTANASLARQWDTSTQDANYIAGGGVVSVIARGLGPVDLQCLAVTNTVHAMSSGASSSDRFRASGQFTWHPSSQVNGGAGVTLYRDVLDEEFSSGAGYSAYMRATPIQRLQFEGRISSRVLDTTILDDTVYTELNARGTYRFVGFDVSGRVEHSRAGDVSKPARTTVVWAEVSRRFAWDL